MNNVVFEKTMEKVKKNIEILNLSEQNRKRNRNEKTEILMNNKPVYLGLSILELSKILMYQFWYDYVKQKYSEKAKLCYMDTVSFIVYIKTDAIYKNIAEDFE